MAKKVSKNSRVSRGVVTGGGKNHVKVIKPVKDPVTGQYSYKEVIIHKDGVKEFFAKK